MTDIPNITFEEVEEALKDYLLEYPQMHDCDVCDIPGVFAPCATNGDESHVFAECCGECRLYDSNEDAAKVIAQKLGLNVRRRYDFKNSPYFHVFLARPGSYEDRDFYCIGAGEFGTHPQAEVPIEDGDDDFVEVTYIIEAKVRTSRALYLNWLEEPTNEQIARLERRNSVDAILESLPDSYVTLKTVNVEDAT